MERVTKAERAAAAAAAASAAAEAERAAEAAEALQRKMSALAPPAAEGVSPYDAAGIDQAPPGYSSVGSSGAPPSLSPLSRVLPLGLRLRLRLVHRSASSACFRVVTVCKIFSGGKTGARRN